MNVKLFLTFTIVYHISTASFKVFIKDTLAIFRQTYYTQKKMSPHLGEGCMIEYTKKILYSGGLTTYGTDYC